MDKDINQAANAYAKKLGVEGMDFDLAVTDFIAGAKWMQEQSKSALID